MLNLPRIPIMNSLTISSRRTAQTALKLWPRTSAPSSAFRQFSATALRQEDDKTNSTTTPTTTTTANKSTQNFFKTLYGSPQNSNSSGENPMASLATSAEWVVKAFATSGVVDTSVLSADKSTRKPVEKETEPYHLHVMATKHNTHITCTKPNREPIISLSCGSLGYKKSRRSGFDSAYSLMKYVIERLIHTGWPMQMQRLEVVLRGYGSGREAAIKVLMSPEGKVLRDKIVRVADSTRLKFGGTRSPRPRRL